MSKLQSSWETLMQAGEPHSVIRVDNLQAAVSVGSDAWGRIGKQQPVLFSVAVSLRNPFEGASEEDSVNKSTVHYGTLSKAILESASQAVGHGSMGLRALYDLVSEELYEHRSRIPVLDKAVAKSLMVKILLPKASLLGSGVSLTGTKVFNAQGVVESRCLTMKLHDLKIPTLIGVNANERLAKQIIIINIELDRFNMLKDCYVPLEEMAVKIIGESSFKTLEALAFHIAQYLVKNFIYPYLNEAQDIENFPRLKIALSKPTAVTFADAPTVEVLVDTDPAINKFYDWQTRKDVE